MLVNVVGLYVFMLMVLEDFFGLCGREMTGAQMLVIGAKSFVSVT